jgi:tRNA(Arg) A34 adenosine deaminase TadA
MDRVTTLRPGHQDGKDKENRPSTKSLADSVTRLSIRDGDLQDQEKLVTPDASKIAESSTEKTVHKKFMDEALDMVRENRPTLSLVLIDSITLDRVNIVSALSSIALSPATCETNLSYYSQARLALRTNETPVGCVLVHNNTIIAKGMNATNITRNGTRHAEYMALSALLSYKPPPANGGEEEASTMPTNDDDSSKHASSSIDGSSATDIPDPEYVRNGHLYPYGQKFHPARTVDKSIITESVLYVTVEPCVMCASLLRQLGIKKVYFGAVNDKFGGTGGVFCIHANSSPSPAIKQTMIVVHEDALPPLGEISNGVQASRVPGAGQNSPIITTSSWADGGGDGGNVERGFDIEGGWGRDEAVGLLRRFYVQENGRGKLSPHMR